MPFLRSLWSLLGCSWLFISALGMRDCRRWLAVSVFLLLLIPFAHAQPFTPWKVGDSELFGSCEGVTYGYPSGSLYYVDKSPIYATETYSIDGNWEFEWILPESLSYYVGDIALTGVVEVTETDPNGSENIVASIQFRRQGYGEPFTFTLQSLPVDTTFTREDTKAYFSVWNRNIPGEYRYQFEFFNLDSNCYSISEIVTINRVDSIDPSLPLIPIASTQSSLPWKVGDSKLFGPCKGVTYAWPSGSTAYFDKSPIYATETYSVDGSWEFEWILPEPLSYRSYLDTLQVSAEVIEIDPDGNEQRVGMITANRQGSGEPFVFYIDDLAVDSKFTLEDDKANFSVWNRDAQGVYRYKFEYNVYEVVGTPSVNCRSVSELVTINRVASIVPSFNLLRHPQNTGYTLVWFGNDTNNTHLLRGSARYNQAGVQQAITWERIQTSGGSYSVDEQGAGDYYYKLAHFSPLMVAGTKIIPAYKAESPIIAVPQLSAPDVVAPDVSLSGNYTVEVKNTGFTGSTVQFQALVAGNWEETLPMRFNVVTGYSEWDFNEQPQGEYFYRAIAFYPECETIESIANAISDALLGNQNACLSDNQTTYARVDVIPSQAILSSAAGGTLSWSQIDGVPYYIIEQYLDSIGWSTVGFGAGTEWVGAEDGETYRVRVCEEEGSPPQNCGIPSETFAYSFNGPQAVPSPVAKPDLLDYGDDTIGSLEGKFRVDESGAATYSIPIITAAGTAGVSPTVSLNYSSAAGRGIAGKGWSVAGGSSISRCRQTLQVDGQAKPITWSEQDRYCLDGKKLLVSGSATISGGKPIIDWGSVPVYGSVNAAYRTEVDSFKEIVSIGGTLGHPAYFLLTGKDGSLSYYGDKNNVSQSKYQNEIGQTYVWAINEFRDSTGNPIKFSYVNDALGFGLSRIDYAFGSSTSSQSNTYVEFEYDITGRPDPTIGYVAGSKFENHLLLTGVRSYSANNTGVSSSLLREYQLEYGQLTDAGTINEKSQLVSVRECIIGDKCKRPTTFEYGEIAPQDDSTMTLARSYALSTALGLSGRVFADINGDGKKDIVWLGAVYQYSEGVGNGGVDHLLRYSIATDDGFVNADFASGSSDAVSNAYCEIGGKLRCLRFFNYPGFGQKIKIQPIDYNADGRQDILIYNDYTAAWYLYLSKPQGDGGWKLSPNGIIMPFQNFEMVFSDLNSDGLVDAWYSGLGSGGPTFFSWHLERQSETQAVTSTTAYAFVAQASKQVVVPASYIPNSAGPIPTTLGNLIKPVGGDFDGDGVMDIAGVLEYITTWGVTGYTGYTTSRVFAIFKEDNAGQYKLVWQVSLNSNLSPFDNNSLVRVGDFNSDGLSDLILRNGTDGAWNQYLSLGALDQFSVAQNLGAMEYQSLGTADLNADGFMDIYWREGGMLKARYWELADEKFSAVSDVMVVSAAVNAAYSFENMDSDSGLELVHFLDTANEQIDIYDYKKTLDDHRSIKTITNGLGAITSISYESLLSTDNYFRIEGISTETVLYGRGPCFATEFGGGCVVPYFKGEIVNSDEFYQQVNAPFSSLPDDALTINPEQSAPILEFFGPQNVVTRIESSAPSANETPGSVNYEAKSAISYFYHQAKVQAAGRGYLGFKRVETIDEQTGVRTTTEYRQDFPFIGAPLKTEVHTASGDLLSQSTNNWQLKSFKYGDFEPSNTAFSNAMDNVNIEGCSVLGSLQPWLKESMDKTFSSSTIDYQTNPDALVVNASVLTTVVNTNTEIDKYGNVLANKIETYAGNIDTGALIKRQSISNVYTPADWAVDDAARFGRLSNTSVLHERFDNAQPSIARASEFTYYTLAEGGLLKTETIELGDPDLELTTLYDYDDFGNKSMVVQTAANDVNGAAPATIVDIGAIGEAANDRYSRWEYDGLGRYVDKTYNGLEHLVEEVVERNVYGIPTKTKNIAGVVTETDYTSFGQPFLTYAPTGGWSHIRYGNCLSGCPNGAVYSVTTMQAGGGVSTQYFDLLGRTIQTNATGYDGRTISTLAEYDAIGRAVRQSTPYYNESDRYWTETRYDILGRPVEITLPHKLNPIIQTFNYSGFTTTSTKTSSNLSALVSGGAETTIQTANALGDVVSVTDALNGVVSYGYDAQGNLLTATTTAHSDGGNVANGVVPASITIALEYDKLGRKIAMNDPDKGYWEYIYNGFGELIEQIDAKGNVTNMSYDALGRLVVRDDYVNPSGDPTDIADYALEATTLWLFDQSGAGRLDEVRQIASNGSLIYSSLHNYDGFGRQASTTTSHDGLSYTQSVTYDQYGRIFQKFDATGNNQGAYYRYATTGYLQSVQEINAVDGEHQTYFTIEGMTARGQVSQVRWGNGAFSARVYDEARGIPQVLKTYVGLFEVQNLTLDFDDFGNLVNRYNQGLGLAANDTGVAKNLLEEFTYDALNRLRSSTVNSGLVQSLTYDSYGNIKNKSDVGTYAYGEVASDSFAGPHAVTSVVTNSSTEVYRYDRNGNLISDTSADGGRTLVYSSFDKPILVTKGNHAVTFSYGPGRARYKRVDTNTNITALSKTTYYQGNVERIVHADGSVEHKRYIEGQVLVTDMLADVNAALPTNSKIQYLIKDHLGSTALVLNHDVTSGEYVAADMSFDAWGKRRKSESFGPMTISELLSYTAGVVNETTTRGFTGHEQLDEVGLVHMNGRIYDPRLARFMQADPFIQASGNTQSYNRYSYVWNNPLSLVDPSGYGASNEVWTVIKIVVFVVVSYFCGGTCSGPLALAMGITSAAQTLNQGGSFGEALIAGVSAAALTYFGAEYAPDVGEFSLSYTLGMGSLGGITSVLQGGKFGHGFVSAGVGAASGGIKGLGGNATGQIVKRALTSAVIGGTVSEATGGKFANGAATAAFASLVASGANAAANKHRQVEAPSQDYKTADIASPDLDPKIEVVAMDESVVIPKPPPGGKVYATPTMQEITVSAQRPGSNSFIGTSGGVLMTATAGEGLAAGYKHRNAGYSRNLISAGKKVAPYALGGPVFGWGRTLTAMGYYGVGQDFQAFMSTGNPLDLFSAGAGLLPSSTYTQPVLDYVQAQPRN